MDPLKTELSFQYTPTEKEAAFLKKMLDDTSFEDRLSEYVDDVLAKANAEFIASGELKMVVGSEQLAYAVREILASRGHDNIEVVVAAGMPAHAQPPLPVRLPEIDGKAEAWRRLQPKHSSVYTKSKPSHKDRKKARRKANAGRKANR